MGGCEDGTCRDIPPPQGANGPWVLYCDDNVNDGFPYWERVANIGDTLRRLASGPEKMAEPVPPPEVPPEVPPWETVK